MLSLQGGIVCSTQGKRGFSEESTTGSDHAVNECWPYAGVCRDPAPASVPTCPAFPHAKSQDRLEVLSGVYGNALADCMRQQSRALEPGDSCITSRLCSPGRLAAGDRCVCRFLNLLRRRPAVYPQSHPLFCCLAAVPLLARFATFVGAGVVEERAFTGDR
jgi:hypothetical protein